MASFKSSVAGALAATTAHMLSLPALAQSGQGEGFAAGSAAAVIVKVAAPWYAPRFLVAGKMRDSIPLYQSLAGLNFKAYSFARADGHFGGIYLWKDATSARAWFSPEWFERVKRERGVPGDVRFFEVLTALDNTPGGTTGNRDASAVGTLVEIPIPAGVTKERLAEGFASSVPGFQKVPGLLRKYFITTSQGKFGGIYLWKDEASARAWFTEAWHNKVQKDYGQPAALEWFDIPILITGKEGNGTWVKGASQP